MSQPDAIDYDTDALTRFALEQSGVRGVMVRLNRTWDEIVSRTEYPTALANRLGECCGAAALFTGHTKIDGRLSIQLNGSGPVRTVFAECSHAGVLRGIAQFTPPVPEPLGPAQFGPDAVLAITIESRPPGACDPIRYQGLVSLDAPDLAAAFESYFSQSEQLATRMLLATDDGVVSALMIQQLPGQSGESADADGWQRSCALFDTLSPTELLQTPVQTLLYRLFHEEGVRVLGSRGLQFGCSCTRERVAGVLVSLGLEEARAAVIDDNASVTCEFCNATYRFSRPEIEALFIPQPPSGRVH